MKHTPGPWNAIKVTTPQYGSPEHGWGVVADSPMRGRIDSAIAGIREPDARLIAAAPDLLKACKALLDIAPFANTAQERSIHDVAQAAIEKAEPAA
jgi:hypothetical protein